MGLLTQIPWSVADYGSALTTKAQYKGAKVLQGPWAVEHLHTQNMRDFHGSRHQRTGDVWRDERGRAMSIAHLLVVRRKML
eukprot:1313583-Amphidinium_carterae.1